jgi:hypothetical protein
MGEINMSANWRYLIIPFVYIVLSYTILLMGDTVYTHLTNEDGFFENLGALAFLAAAIMLILTFFRSRIREDHNCRSAVKLMMYLILALAMFLAAGEEISWGQRIIGIDTPEAIRSVNTQDEINLHNLEMFQISYKRNALRWVWNLFWLTFTLAIPAAATIFKSRRKFIARFIPVIPWTLGLIFLINYSIWRVIYSLAPVEVYKNFPEEIMESNLAVLFLVTSIWIIRESLPTYDPGQVDGMGM